MAAVLAMWNGAPTDRLAELLAPAYRGHVLGVANGERDGAAYPASISRYREAVPGVAFEVVEQFDAGDRLVTRLEARRAGPDAGRRSVSHGVNISRFGGAGRLDEEWAIWSAWQEAEERPSR
ncbi:MAG: nuclear transport factor 2 family protein [Chloroflexi bacterium]|nr:nuclear transport factor 2 family protein [Chloroflexota bacterium]